MNRTEHLLTVLSEECIEVAKEVSKALRFGLDDFMPDPPLNGTISNRQRIAEELRQVMAMADWLHEEGVLPFIFPDRDKRERVERYMEYARASGALSPIPSEGKTEQ